MESNQPGSITRPSPKRVQKRGFTLAELLISLLILAEIATFSIPKILNAQQLSLNKAKAKEVAAMISQAFQQAQFDGVVTANTKPADLTPYFNYLAYDTSGTVIDGTPWVASSPCNSTTPCIKLHNGGVLWFGPYFFSSTDSLAAIDFRFDPDISNNTTSTADGPLKAVQFTLYYNGFITTRGQAKSGTFSSCCTYPLNPANDPSWFTWN